MKPPRSAVLAAWLRGFAVQGAWNYRTLVGSGIAYAMMPLLSRIYAGDPVGYREALQRHLENFNGHPYLCGMAVGALARLEYDGVDAERIRRFRVALRGPLGTIGDRLVWAGWRPFCVLVAVCAFGLGMPAWRAVVAFLVVYNVGHLWLRAWAFHTGWQAGLDVGRRLTATSLERWTAAFGPVNMILAGAVVVLIGRQLPGVDPIAGWVTILAVGMALLAYRWPSRFGRAAVGILLATPVVWYLIRG